MDNLTSPVVQTPANKIPIELANLRQAINSLEEDVHSMVVRIGPCLTQSTPTAEVESEKPCLSPEDSQMTAALADIRSQVKRIRTELAHAIMTCEL